MPQSFRPAEWRCPTEPLSLLASKLWGVVAGGGGAWWLEYLKRSFKYQNMSPKTLIERKFRARWSDVQLLVLLVLADEQMSAFAELVTRTGASETGVWNALSMAQTQDCVERFAVGGKTFYHLSEKGRADLQKLLS